MPRHDRKPDRRLPRLEGGGFFFGELVEAEAWQASPKPGVEISKDFGLAGREKEVRIVFGESLSPHVVDLSPPPAAAPAPVKERKRGRLPVLAHGLKRLLRHPSAEEFERLVPKRGKLRGGSFGEFARLPFLMLLLPFRKLFARRPRPPKPEPALKRAPAPKPAPEPVPERAIAPPPRARSPKRGAPALIMRAPLGLGRKLASFGLVALVLVVPILLLASLAGALDDIDLAERNVTIALGALKEAGAGAARLDAEAAGGFDRAARAFSDTRERLRGSTVALGALFTGNAGRLRDGHRLLKAGEEAAKAGERLSAAFDDLDAASDKAPTERVAALAAAFREALPHLEASVAELEAASPKSVPKEHRDELALVLRDLRAVLDHARRFTASSDLLLEMLGGDGKRRYLVLFQNDRELRPTGGFIGSYALMDVLDGRIVKTEIPAGGSYDLRGGLTAKVAAPDELRLVNARWEFQDANWFADFPTSARALVWFYEKSGGPTVDGVLAVTTGFMEDLLGVIGPVELEEHGKTVTASNFWLETQKAVELEYDRETNRPKQIISDMAPLVLERLMDLDGGRLLPLMNAVSGALARKRLLFHFRDDEHQALASDYGWTGELAPLPKADFLAVVDSNIAGGKTDGVISAEIRLESEIGDDGGIVNTLTVRRTHHGETGDLFTGIKNIDFMRVYAPRGSVLLSAEGFERPGGGYFLEADGALETSAMLEAALGRTSIHEPSGTAVTEESGLAVFGNWIQLEPGESRAVRLVYRLPFTARDLVREPETALERFKAAIGAHRPTAHLRLVVRRQPGAENRTFSSVLRFPPGWRILSRVPHDAAPSESALSWSGRLDRDLYLGAVASVKE